MTTKPKPKPGCIVCGHPTGIQCCEFGRPR